MHNNNKLLFEKYALPKIKSDMRVLEIGPDSFPSTLYLSCGQDITWETLDIRNNPKLTYPGCEEYSFPIPDNYYDIVLSGQVIEHVKKPWIWIKELARITKINGMVITINPVSWVYHEVPVDCWRIYPDGMKALYAEGGLEVELSTWESLETPNYRRFSYGISKEWQTRKKRTILAFLGIFGFPVERAYDTITIGYKKN